MTTLDIPKIVPPTLQSSLAAIRSGILHPIPLDDFFLLSFLFFSAVYYLGKGRLWERPDPYHYKFFERPQLRDGDALSTAPAQTRNVAEKLQEADSDVVIFWGSQSGTAEGFAHRLAREFRQRFRREALVLDLSDYEPNTISVIPQTKAVVFILATYGEGDPCDNSWDFMNWLNAQVRKDVRLSNLQYAAFGLGNSNYRYYNKVINDAVQLLEGLGATDVAPMAKGDEAMQSTEEDFVEWKDSLLRCLCTTMSLTSHEVEYEPRLEVTEGSIMLEELSTLPVGKHTSKKAATKASLITALPVHKRCELISGSPSSRKCIHLELDLSKHPHIKYKTGDHISVWPVNPDVEVSGLLEILHLKARRNNFITIRPLEEEAQLDLPARSTIQVLFKHHLDICGPVKRDTVLSLARFASTEKVRLFLWNLGKDKVTYSRFLEQHHVTFARLLQHTLNYDQGASWALLPLPVIIESMPPITPRTYSISSSSVISPRYASITVAVAPTPLVSNPNVTIRGLASTYLASEECESLYAQIITSSFKLPVLSTTPVIMVAAGTGIAPFHGFIQERARLASTGRPVGRMLLFFGCQYPDHDYLYKSEIHELMAGSLTGKLQIFNAFSRVRREKRYVQHVLHEQIAQVCKLLLEEDAAFYICGSAIMAKSVKAVLAEGVGREKHWSLGEVEGWRRERKRAKLWHEDVWG